jgi:hypothetical protein
VADVFISFIHQEEIVAKAMQRLLRRQMEGAGVFLSSDWTIYAGEDWLHKIQIELSTAKVVVLLLSETSVTRPWVNFEAGGAWLAGKAVIPVCHAGLVPALLPKPYSNFQALVIPQDTYYLVRSVYHHLYPEKTDPLPFANQDPAEAEFKREIEEFNSSI